MSLSPAPQTIYGSALISPILTSVPKSPLKPGRPPSNSNKPATLFLPTPILCFSLFPFQGFLVTNLFLHVPHTTSLPPDSPNAASPASKFPKMFYQGALAPLSFSRRGFLSCLPKVPKRVKLSCHLPVNLLCSAAPTPPSALPPNNRRPSLVPKPTFFCWYGPPPKFPFCHRIPPN